MSTKKVLRKVESSISMRSAKRRISKNRPTQNALVVCSTTSSLREVESVPSSSLLAELYASEAFRLASDNDIAFHVANNAIRLRKFRSLSQSEVAIAMKTSQSKVARIEGGDDNITLKTLVKVVNALKGRLRLSIEPKELHLPRFPQWWDMVGANLHSDSAWNMKLVHVIDKGNETRAVAGFVTEHEMKLELIESGDGQDMSVEGGWIQ